ncbi:MAG TPA: cytochrome b/b6 domain-containing protein [Marivita sp.]|nr:cytochrome b/b6 domain-containing protein [Marivita sp.]
MTSYLVWDPFIRVFHWALAAGFAANALIIDDDSKLHEWLGYTLVALIGARLVWGVVGSSHARFASFRPTLSNIAGQMSDIATGRKRLHLGHSPLGALMIFNLMGAVLLIALTGFMMTTNAFWGVEWVEELHEALVIWAEISIVLHVLAVIWESRRTGVNLPRAMITGVKTVPDTLRKEP